MRKSLPKPLEKQREVLYLPVTGHSVVLGTAGSGKTTLALYRAAFLSTADMPHSGRTLLLTFNQALVTYLNHLKPFELRNVGIETYHKFARGYLNSRGKMKANSICKPELKEILINKALSNVTQRYEKSKFFERPLAFFVDEISWILSNGIETEEQYIAGERVGRVGTNLARRLRSIMYEILKEYLALRSQNGKQYDWDDIAYYVRKEYLQDDRARLYRHIIIDEGQDFSPEMIRSLVSAVPEDGSLTFFGDIAQQIYGQRTSWRFAGLKVPQVWEFKQNYRNTKQIARLGLAISRMPYFEGIADIVEPTFPRADGPLPTIAKCENQAHEMEIALRVAKDSGKAKSVAVLFKNREQEKLLSSRLPVGAIQLHRDMGSWKDGPGIYYGTYHSAKGLEFDTVILPLLEKDNLPDLDYINSHDVEDALTHDGRLLYVAVTRARTDLLLLYTKEPTPLLPSDDSLYNRVSP